MSRLKRVIVEVHRRSLWQVLGIYLVGSWIGYEVILALTEGVGLPDWVPAFAIVLFIVGLPIVLATAFVQEGIGSRGRPAEPVAEPADPMLLFAADALPGEHVLPLEHDRLAAAPAGTSAAGSRQHALLTWHRAVLGGVVAFLLLGVTAGGYMGMRNAGIGPFGSLIAAGTLAEREAVVIAEFQSAGGDSLLARAVTEAFRVDLEQSAAIQVVETGRIRGVLARMGRDASDRLTPTLAREIAVRDNIKAVVEGEVNVGGGTFIVTARLLSADGGAVLASARETARDSTAIVPAVDRLARKLREKIGESLRSIRADQPLEAVTTGSLEALRKYSQALWALDVEADYPVAIALLEEAVALDSAFAMAWRKLAVAYNNSGMSQEKRVYAATRAYQYRDRLTEREKGLATAYYYDQVERNNERVIAAYRTVLDRYPDDVAALNNIGLAYWRQREYVRARDSFGRAVEVDSTSLVTWGNLAEAHFMLGDAQAAERVVDGFAQRFGADRPAVLSVRYFLESGRGNYDEAERLATATVESRQGGLVWRNRGNAALSDLAMLRGRLERAEHYREQARRANEERGSQGSTLFAQSVNARMDLFVRNDAAGAVRRLDEALAREPFATVYRMDRPYLIYVQILARAGQADRARALLAEYDREVPAEFRSDDRFARSLAHGQLALAANDAAEALNAFREADRSAPCPSCVLPHIAEAYDMLGQVDSAVAVHERFISTPDSRRIWSDNFFLPRAHERLAELYQTKGDLAKAAAHAARFVELWQDADAELQPRVRAKQELLVRLQERR